MADQNQNELEEVKQYVAQWRRRTIYLVGALLIAVTTAGVAALFVVEAQRQSRRSLSSQLAAQSTSLMDNQPDLALLLSIESRFVNNTVESQPGLSTVLRAHSEWVTSVAFSPDGKTLASGGMDNTVILWDVSNLKLPVVLGAPLKGQSFWVDSVAFSPDGKTLASAGVGYDKTLLLWDVSNPKAPVELAAPIEGHANAWQSAVTFSPDGKTLASGGEDGAILWDVSNPKVPVQLGVPLSGLTQGVFSPDSKTLASGGSDITLWDVSNPKSPVDLDAPYSSHAAAVTSVAFSPDGKTLASGSCGELAVTSIQLFRCIQGKIILWDVSNPKAPLEFRAPLSGHSNSVESVAFSPDGTTLASGSSDETIILWDVSNPKAPIQLVKELSGHALGVTSVAFSPDGKTLASIGLDDTIVLWDVGAILWQARACQSAGRNLSRAEWAQYLGNEQYRQTCLQWPEGK